MTTFHLEVVTPEGRAFSDDVDSVVLPGVEGEFGILPQHMPLLTEIKPGEMAIRKGNEEWFVAVGSGFVEVLGDRVSVLTDMASRPEEIDEAKAEEARQRAEKALRERLSDEELAKVTAALERSLAQLHVKRRRKERRQ